MDTIKHSWDSSYVLYKQMYVYYMLYTTCQLFDSDYSRDIEVLLVQFGHTNLQCSNTHSVQMTNHMAYVTIFSKLHVNMKSSGGLAY